MNVLSDMCCLFLARDASSQPYIASANRPKPPLSEHYLKGQAEDHLFAFGSSRSGFFLAAYRSAHVCVVG